MDIAKYAKYAWYAPPPHTQWRGPAVFALRIYIIILGGHSFVMIFIIHKELIFLLVKGLKGFTALK